MPRSHISKHHGGMTYVSKKAIPINLPKECHYLTPSIPMSGTTRKHFSFKPPQHGALRMRMSRCLSYSCACKFTYADVFMFTCTWASTCGCQRSTEGGGPRATCSLTVLVLMIFLASLRGKSACVSPVTQLQADDTMPSVLMWALGQNWSFQHHLPRPVSLVVLN